MALIKCKECGHEVSDKASACPNCGCPIEKEHVCNECGALISSEDEFCPNCGNPIRENMSVSEDASSNVELIAPNEYPNKPKRNKLKTIWGLIALAAIVLVIFVGVFFYMDSIEKERLEHEAMLNAKADSARVAGLAAQAAAEQAAAEQARLDSIKAAEEEERERERELKTIVGTYIFTPSETNYATVDMYDGQRWWKERKIVGSINWTEYLVVMEDYRVSLLTPSHRGFVGTITDFNNGTFVISVNNSENKSVGAWTTIYRNGKEIGRLGEKGYGFPNKIVIDTKTRRIYNGVDDYKNRDISDVEYIMYDRFSPVIEKSNNTEVKREYLSKEYERKYGM